MKRFLSQFVALGGALALAVLTCALPSFAAHEAPGTGPAAVPAARTAGAPGQKPARDAYDAMHDRLDGANAGIDSVLSILPGAEIIHTTGNLTLGSSGSDYSRDWNLAPFRFGPQGAPGLLTLRAAGNIVLFNSISYGFADGRTDMAVTLTQGRNQIKTRVTGVVGGKLVAVPTEVTVGGRDAVKQLLDRLLR